MTDSNYTALAVIVDRSGSMMNIALEAKNTLNKFVEDQRNEPGRATLRLTQFDNTVEFVFPSTDLNDVPEIDLVPRGMTALNDAIGQTVVSLGEELAALPEDERPGQVLVIVVTDGAENSSREYVSHDIKRLVEEQQDKYGWKFTFIGANQDAVLTARSYGIGAGDALTFNTNHISVASVGASLHANTSATRSGLAYVYSESERAAAAQ